MQREDDQDPYAWDQPGPAGPAAPSAPTGDPWTAAELAESQNWANQYYTSHQIPAGWGTPDDLGNAYLQQRRNGVGHQAAMDAVPGLLGWDKYTPPSKAADPTQPDPGPASPPPPAPAPAPGPSDGPTTTPPPIDNAPPAPRLDDPFPTPAPVPNPAPLPTPQPLPTPIPVPNAPLPAPEPVPTVADSIATIPGAPAFPTIPRFAQPTMAEAMADDGYKFVLDQGNKNLQNWAAARGTLNDSSTGKAFIDYGQGAATTQYGNVWDRAYKTYDSDVNTQYVAPWQAAYQNWMTGTVGPTMTQFGARASDVANRNALAGQNTLQQNALGAASAGQQNSLGAQNVMQQNSTASANQAHLNDVSWQDNWNRWLQDWNIFRDQRDSTFDKRFKVATA